MADKDCSECFVKDLHKIHRLVEKRALEKLPEEVREPLQEAKRQMRLALRGLVTHLLEEKPVCKGKQPDMSRPIKVE